MLHQADLSLWKDRGEALQYGFQLDPLPNPDHFLLDGEILSVGSIEMVVHHTPGHSPGHVVFAIPQEKVIFTGDLIFAGSIGRTDLTGGDLDELLNSIRKTILSCADETRLLPGHGPETTVGYERLNNPYSNIKMGENILAHLYLHAILIYFANSTARISRMTVTLI